MILGCTAPFSPPYPARRGPASGYVAKRPQNGAKTRQKPRKAPRCSVVSPCTGRNRAALRRSSEPLHASQARATLRRSAAPADQSRRPRRARLLPQERPHAEEAKVDVKTTSLSVEMVRGIITASRGRVSSTAPHPDPGEVRIAPPAGGTFNQFDSSATRCAPHALDTRHACTVASHGHSHAPRRPSPPLSPRFSALCLRWLS